MNVNTPQDKLKSWLPVIITAVSIIGFFYAQSYRISALEVRADDNDMRWENISPKVDQLLLDMAVVKTDITYIKSGIDEIKRHQ